MSALTRDEMGFVRANRYGKASRSEVDALLGSRQGDALYHSSVERGARTSQQVKGEQIDLKPGDTLSAGPVIDKAALLGGLFSRDGSNQRQPNGQRHRDHQRKGVTKHQLSPLLRKEIEAMRRAGYGWVDEPRSTRWGLALHLKGITLPGGVRTEALILLPKNYPLTAPIGFYIRKGEETATLDTSHLFNRSYHDAPDLTAEGWQWFCGIAQSWKPGHHNLVGYLSMVFAMFNE